MNYYAIWTPEGETTQVVSCFGNKVTLYAWLMERSEVRGRLDFINVFVETFFARHVPMVPDHLKNILVIKGDIVEPRPTQVVVKEWWVD